MQVPDILRNKRVQIGLTAVVASSCGAVIGYILGKRNGNVYVLPESAVKLEPMPYLKITETGKVELSEKDPELEALLDEEEAAAERYAEGQRTLSIVPQLDEEPLTVNVFPIQDDDWDYEAELSSRDPEVPYVIHQEEFVEDEMGYHQETMTYYEGDDIMADPTDTPIYGYSGLMGELKFGHGSKDSNVVYIRNEKIHMEWEVLRHTSSFSEEVLGLQADAEAEKELRHSGVQKFRRE